MAKFRGSLLASWISLSHVLKSIHSILLASSFLLIFVLTPKWHTAAEGVVLETWPWRGPCQAKQAARGVHGKTIHPRQKHSKYWSSCLFPTNCSASLGACLSYAELFHQLLHLHKLLHQGVLPPDHFPPITMVLYRMWEIAYHHCIQSSSPFSPQQAQWLSIAAPFLLELFGCFFTHKTIQQEISASFSRAAAEIIGACGISFAHLPMHSSCSPCTKGLDHVEDLDPIQQWLQQHPQQLAHQFPEVICQNPSRHNGDHLQQPDRGRARARTLDCTHSGPF